MKTVIVQLIEEQPELFPKMLLGSVALGDGLTVKAVHDLYHRASPRQYAGRVAFDAVQFYFHLEGTCVGTLDEDFCGSIMHDHDRRYCDENVCLDVADDKLFKAILEVMRKLFPARYAEKCGENAVCADHD